MLNKGVPSTFANMKALYDDPSKRDIIQALVTEYVANGVPAPESKTNGATEEKKTNGAASDDSKASALYFLAQHFNYSKSRDLKKAMEYAEKAIALAPKSIEYNMTKARIYKHHGDLQKAAEAMEATRLLDTSDRYINTKTAKYQLKNDQNELAIRNMGKFTKAEAVGGPLGDLHELQCMWFISEDGQSYLRQGNLGLALKRFTAVASIFDVWAEDQFDFHSYSLKTAQSRAYVDMIRWEDTLREHPYFTDAAIAASEIYVLLHQRPDLVHGQANGALAGIDKMDEAEKKKALKKAKKDQQKLEKANAAKSSEGKADALPWGAITKEDDDPLGRKLLQAKEPLKEAMAFVTPLLQLSPNSIDAQSVGFEVFIRRGKNLQSKDDKLLTIVVQRNTCRRSNVSWQ
jgi:N-alpha-acetyltransferase 15/16, NatA auxiliary subunit